MNTASEACPDRSLPRGRGSVDLIGSRIVSFVETRRWLLLLLAALGYLGMTVYRASRKTFWYDEIYTVVLSRLPDFPSLWNALMHGSDFNPPFFYLLTRGAEKLVGAGHVGARLPEIVGFGVFCLCLYRFVRVRSSAFGGLIAMLFPMCTTAYAYAYEARPHGLVMGFCGLAMISWQAAASGAGRQRLLWIAGLGLALAGALSSHAYGLLIFVPVAAAEATRSLLRRKVDVPMWAAILAALLPLGVVLLLARVAAMPGVAGEWAGWYTSFDQAVVRLIDSYVWFLSPAMAALIVALAGLAAGGGRNGSKAPPAAPWGAVLPWPETVLLAALSLLPLFAMLLSLATGSSLSPRYGISAVGSIAVLLGLALAHRPLAGLAVLAAMLVQIGSSFIEYGRLDYMHEASTRSRLSTHLSRLEKRYEVFSEPAYRDLPIALVDMLDFATVFWYAKPADRARMAYVMAPATDGNGRLYRRLRECCAAPGAVSDVKAFSAAHGEFLVYGQDRSMHRLQDFVDAGARVRMLQASRHDFLALVTP